MELDAALRAFRERFTRAGEPEEAWEAFEAMYRAYRSGQTGQMPWEEVAPPAPEDLVPLESLDTEATRRAGAARMDRVVWIVLNGGLGTSMRMNRAKSLVPVKGSLTFLDLIARHVKGLRERTGVDLPVVFMNSFATREDTLRALEPYDLPVRGIPLDFVQHRFPRIREEDGLPFGDPDDPAAWAPPGHGNIYAALRSSGLLDRLLEAGVRWAFVSNADNLGASPHPGILGFVAEQGIQFVMEVTPKTAADVKGGTLVRRDGRLELLEIAQVPAEHVEEFQDLDAFPVFNTNNLWFDLKALRERVAQGGLCLPLIVNRKEVEGTRVVQLEVAMGAAIGRFPRAAGVVVDRRRFAPVKTTDDLLVRRSDVYVVGTHSPLEPNPARDPGLGPPVVRLDPAYYRSVPDLDLRIPWPPSLVEALRLEVKGDVRFGRGVRVRGRVRIENPGPAPLEIPDGAVLAGT